MFDVMEMKRKILAILTVTLMIGTIFCCTAGSITTEKAKNINPTNNDCITVTVHTWLENKTRTPNEIQDPDEFPSAYTRVRIQEWCGFYFETKPVDANGNVTFTLPDDRQWTIRCFTGFNYRQRDQYRAGETFNDGTYLLDNNDIVDMGLSYYHGKSRSLSKTPRILIIALLEKLLLKL
jgi:hypothetical protein